MRSIPSLQRPRFSLTSSPVSISTASPGCLRRSTAAPTATPSPASSAIPPSLSLSRHSRMNTTGAPADLVTPATSTSSTRRSAPMPPVTRGTAQSRPMLAVGLSVAERATAERALMWHSSTLLVAVQLRRTWDTARRGSIIKPLLEEKPGMFVREGDVCGRGGRGDGGRGGRNEGVGGVARAIQLGFRRAASSRGFLASEIFWRVSREWPQTLRCLSPPLHDLFLLGFITKPVRCGLHIASALDASLKPDLSELTASPPRLRSPSSLGQAPQIQSSVTFSANSLRVQGSSSTLPHAPTHFASWVQSRLHACRHFVVSLSKLFFSCLTLRLTF